jgi:uncharacterized protein
MSHANASKPSLPVHDVTVKRLRIPMRDGVRLFATAWHPEGNGRFPVVINYDPYRSADGRTLGRGNWFHYLARHGYVVLHLGVRGTDGSEGTVGDEYLPQEQMDGYDAVEWLAQQPWCNGHVGMMGTSYSGFTCLQVAMHRPPHLKAIIPLLATDDRYTDDVHYTPGGALRALCDMPSYGLMMVCKNALPPHESVGADFARIWEAHLQGNEPYQIQWLDHQTDGPYWRHASLRPNYDRIECAVFIVSGWSDGYVNATLRVFQHLRAPKQALVGPWTHMFPEWGMPEPAIGFMAQAVRWFDHWLKGADTGLLDEPPLTLYMQEYDPPHEGRRRTSGYWRAERAWPVPGHGERTLFLGPGGTLRGNPVDDGRDTFVYRATVGTTARSWGGMPWLQNAADQRPDELHSLVYTSEPLGERLEVLGQPQVALVVASTAPVANVVCKLCDVAADGTSAMITSGILNLTHRRSNTDPEPAVPGQEYPVEIALDATAWVFAPGHRIRLDIAGSDWPNIWPSPYPAQTTVRWGRQPRSRLSLPTAPPSRPEDAPDMGQPAMPLDRYVLHSPPPQVRIGRDPLADRSWIEASMPESGTIPGEVDYAFDRKVTFEASDRDPAHAAIRADHSMRIVRHGMTTVAHARGRIESSAEAFHFHCDLVVTVDGAERFRRSWLRSFPRNLV